MMVDATTVYVMGVVCGATLIRSTFGFGEALVAVPLLALKIPVAVAAPLAVLVSITVAAVVVVQDWEKVHVRSALWLVASTMLGIPLGLWLLIHLDRAWVEGVLGGVIILFSGYSLVGARGLVLERDRRSVMACFGVVAGVLGGAYGMNGPPLVVYGSLRRWSAQHFRATLQGYFLPASMVGMAGYWLAGLWVPEVTRLYWWSLPGAAAAIVAGRAANRRLEGRVFLKMVHVGLLVIGGVLVAEAVRGG
jgi:uncharacterized membrane protein YfcA